MRFRANGQYYVFAVTVFLSAFLLFQVQPLIGKYILPWFGGSPTVWTVCMLFFQLLLFGGYAYAHLTTRLIPAMPQSILHLVLLVSALVWLPITPDDAWKPSGSGDPTWRIIVLLTACVGLPYFVLSSTGPLLQAWFHRVHPDRSPYPLYALSNGGSLIALVSYPFLFDPNFAADQQTVVWSWAFGAFAIGCGLCAWQILRLGSVKELVREKARDNKGKTRPTWNDGVLWFLLAMVPSVMLLATTNQICTDVAVIPFLWVLPLTLYLLSFILCFHSERWCPRSWWSIGWAVAVIAIVPVMYKGQAVVNAVPVRAQIAAYGTLLFCCAMLCHGELVRLKPHPTHLTSFYLTLAAGGAAGGFFVGVVAPLVFPTYVELPLGLVGCTVLTLVVFYRDQSWMLYRGRPRGAWACLLLGLLALVCFQVDLFVRSVSGVQAIHRSFYGVTRVKAEPVEWAKNELILKLIHGRTMHGKQFASEKRRLWPTTYYGEKSGAGLILRNHRRGEAKRVGIVGLGIGTLAAYGNEGDTYRFYEINPDMIDLAERFFAYVEACKTKPEFVEGDARMSLENELENSGPQEFDVLVLDAFSSDAVPVHLLTHEAFELYLRHLKPDGVLAVHASNVHLDLRRVVAGHAESFDLKVACVSSPKEVELGTSRAVWELLSRKTASLQFDAIQETKLAPERRSVFWTDKRNSLFQVLKKGAGR